MKLGITMFPTADSIGPGALAAAIEARGFESFWVPEHSHFPVSPFTPGRGEGGLPPKYYEVVDPFVALAMAAEATTHLRLGTSICLVVQRDPIQLAKQVASLDVLSGGRFEFGVGGGWHPLEMGNHGTPFDQRMAILRERIEAMQRIWSDDQAEFHGEHVDFGPLYAWPKPLQRPHPPIHMAANAPKGLGRVVRHATGWIPLASEGEQEARIFSQLPLLRRRLAEAGRDPASVEVSYYMCPRDPAVVQQCRDAGIQRVIFEVEPAPEAEALAALDAVAKLAG